MKIAIVTGASSGMGREFVLQLSQYVQVDEIWAIARREDALKALQAAVPVRPVPLDLCDSASFARLAALLEQEKPEVKLLRTRDRGQAQILVTIHEGRNRQVRRMCEAAGMHCTRLRRVREGSLSLGDLPLGKWRYLTEAEVKNLT